METKNTAAITTFTFEIEYRINGMDRQTRVNVVSAEPSDDQDPAVWYRGLFAQAESKFYERRTDGIQVQGIVIVKES